MFKCIKNVEMNNEPQTRIAGGGGVVTPADLHRWLPPELEALRGVWSSRRSSSTRPASWSTTCATDQPRHCRQGDRTAPHFELACASLPRQAHAVEGRFEEITSPTELPHTPDWASINLLQMLRDEPHAFLGVNHYHRCTSLTSVRAC
jgi:hypothetical protein